jgi:hypothetical protein
MATFTITSSVNIDSLPLKTGSDSYFINGGYLTIDQDSRYGTNQSLTSMLGPVTISTTIGGTVEVNATKVRLIPFESGSGNVPGYDTIISQGSASGKLLTVYSSTFGIPVTTGSAMPSSGFIKIRQWNSTNFTTGSLSGITASSTGQDTAGWLEIVGRDATSTGVNDFTIPRLGEAKFLGDWYYVGTTSGNRVTTYEIPGNGSRTFLAGVWVETTSSSDVYEFYPYAQDKLATSSAIPTDYLRGKVCWISTASILRFGHDGTNSNGGYLPPSGSRIRIPNIFLYGALAGGEATNSIPTGAIDSRYEFKTTGAGRVTLDKVACSGWYANFVQPYSVNISSSAIMSYLNISECPTYVQLYDAGLSQVTVNPALFGVRFNLCQEGGSIENCVFAINTQNQSLALTDCENFTLKNNKIIALGSKNISNGVLEGTRLSNCVFSGNTIGVGELKFTQCQNIKVYSSTYYSVAVGRPPAITSSNSPANSVAASCENILFDGLSYGGLFDVGHSSFLKLNQGGCSNIILRNIGSIENPLAISTSNKVYDAPWSRVTTVATVTKNNHSLKSGDNIHVFITSNSTTIPLGGKFPTVINSNTFTIPVVNSGDLTGTISYVGTGGNGQNYIIAADVNSAANNIKLQRIYTTRLPIAAMDFGWNNSNKDIKLQSVMSDFDVGSTYTQWYGFYARNNIWNKIGFKFDYRIQPAIYGSHFVDQYIAGISENTGSQSWTRSSTTITVSSLNHKLITGDQISVLTSSSTSAITLGIKTITAVDSNTFRFTGLNAGNLSGTLSFVPINGAFWILMNENSIETANQITLSGSSAFDATGDIVMSKVNDSAIFETPSFILGYKNFPIRQVSINDDPSTTSRTAIERFDITYSINKGSGYGSYKNLSYPRAGGGGSNGSTTVTMTNTTGVAVGDYVFGTNIGGNARVVSIDSSTNITVDQANTGTVSGVLYFNALPGESDIPSTGFKIKVKIVVNATNSTLLTNIHFDMMYDSITRTYDYPLDETSVTLTNLKNPSEVRIFDAANPTVEITGQESVTGGTYTTTVDSATYPLINIAILSLGYQNIRLTNIDISGGDINFPIQQQIDRQYLNP